MNKALWIPVWLLYTPIHYFAIIQREHPFIGMLMRPNCQIHTKLHEHVFQTKPVEEGDSHANSGFMFGTVVGVVVGAVHGPMGISYYPGAEGTVFRLSSFL